MTNRLAASASPYLLQHQENPVDWWEWGPDAFAEAARRDVPVLLSIGYAACHWCHVILLSVTILFRLSDPRVCFQVILVESCQIVPSILANSYV